MSEKCLGLWTSADSVALCLVCCGSECRGGVLPRTPAWCVLSWFCSQDKDKRPLCSGYVCERTDPQTGCQSFQTLREQARRDGELRGWSAAVSFAEAAGGSGFSSSGGGPGTLKRPPWYLSAELQWASPPESSCSFQTRATVSSSSQRPNESRGRSSGSGVNTLP